MFEVSKRTRDCPRYRFLPILTLSEETSPRMPSISPSTFVSSVKIRMAS